MINSQGNKAIAMIISACCLFFSLCMFSIALAENYIGIILDGYQNDCIVHSRGEDYNCTENRQLYAGDKIVKKNIKALKIKWAPYAIGRELDEKSLLVIFEPPKDKKDIVQGIREFLGLVKTGHSISMGATRGDIDEVVLQPGNNATMISGRESIFAWDSEGGKYIIFKDSFGKEIFRKNLEGRSCLQLSPEEIGLKTGEIYVWNVSGTRNSKQYKIKLLSQEIAQQVNADLRKIEKETPDIVNKTIQKAGYLQFISDAYPQDIDLYWLSYLILNASRDEKISNDENVLFGELRRNYLRHVRERI
jgi:hypothetical protein